jgi:TolB-like protein
MSLALTTLALIATSSGAATTTATIAAPAPASTFTGRVAVYDLRSRPEHAAIVRRVSDRLLLQLGKKRGVAAIGQAEMAVLLEHHKDEHDVGSCDGEESCLAEASRAVEADKVISGHLGRWGEGWLVALSLTDAKKAAVERGSSVTAESEAELFAELGPLLDRLLGASEDAARFQLPIAGGTKVAVLNLAPYDTSAELADNLTQLLALELRRFEGVAVISRDEIKTMLQYEAEKQVVQCKNDVSCLVEIGGALGVEYLVTGGVGRLEDTFVIHLKLMDVRKAEVANRVSETLIGTERQLAQAVRFATWALLGKPVEGQGTAWLTTDADEAEAAIDGGRPVPLPARLALPSGKHALSVIARGYKPRSLEFYVEDGLESKLDAELVELPRPWYREWWPWAIIGSAVAAGAVTSVLLTTQSPNEGQVDVTIEGAR